MTTGRGPVRPELTLGLLVFLLTLVASSSLTAIRRPLLAMGGLTDEWFPLGYNLAAFGTLGWGDQPILLRPPGYPAFIAAILGIAAPPPAAEATPAYDAVAFAVVSQAQALLLAATAALLFVALRRRVGNALATMAALLYGLNPYSLLLPGLLHYDVLHHFVLVAGCLALDRALDRAGTSPWPLAAAGAFWGVAALIRPVTLPLPVFVLLMILARGIRGRRAAVALLAFSLAMGAAIAPWTARNYFHSGRVVPINIQGWAAVWGSSVERLKPDPNEYQWAAVAATYMLPLHRRVTGENYDYHGYVKHNAALEAAFKHDALENLRRQPGVYAWNVARGFLSMSLQINTAMVSAFQRIQREQVLVSQSWFWTGHEAERTPTRASRTTGALFGLLTVLAAIGFAQGARRRDLFLLVPGLVYLCAATAHALTFVDFMYYYLRVPFLIVFAAVGMDALGAWGLRVAAGLLALAVTASAVLLLGI